MDPQGPFGLGVVRFASDQGLRDFLDGDPTVAAGLNTTEHYAMRAVYPGS